MYFGAVLSWDDISLLKQLQIQNDNTFCLEQNTIQGHIVFCPQVGRLNCGSSSVDHKGYWELEGYGLVGVYKSDWIRFGGKLLHVWFSSLTYFVFLQNMCA